jgi:hypothetical protein
MTAKAKLLAAIIQATERAGRWAGLASTAFVEV